MLGRFCACSGTSTSQSCLHIAYRRHGFELLANGPHIVKVRYMPASSDDGTFMQLRPTLEVVTPKHVLHLDRAEVREEETKSLEGWHQSR